MPAIAVEQKQSTGHGCWQPTQPIGPFTTTSTFGGKRVQLRGVTIYQPHTCGVTTHADSLRKIVDPGGSTFFLEGKPVAFLGDMIQCGDMVAGGAESTFGN